MLGSARHSRSLYAQEIRQQCGKMYVKGGLRKGAVDQKQMLGMQQKVREMSS